MEKYYRLNSKNIDQLYGKKILLYGLNDDTKKAIMYLSGHGISIIGFLVAADDHRLAGMESLGKPILGKTDFLNMDAGAYTVLDVYGHSLQEIWDIFHVHGKVLFEIQPSVQTESFLIYGTGTSGKNWRRCWRYLVLVYRAIAIEAKKDMSGCKAKVWLFLQRSWSKLIRHYR